MNKTHAMHVIGVAGLGALMALVSAPTRAQDDGYFYGGAGLGQSRAEIDEDRIAAGLAAAGLTMTSMTRDERDTAYKLFGGYQFNRHLAVEAGYFNLGRFGFASTTTPAGSLNGQIKLHGLNLDLVGTLPLGRGFSAIGRVGAQHASARDTFRGDGAVTVLDRNPTKRATGLKYGVGLQYELSHSFFVRAEAERYRIDDAVGNKGDVNMFSVSLVVPFGRAPRQSARAPAPPAYVAAAPAPAPAPQIVAAPPAAPAVAPPPPPPPERRRVSFAADSLFDFDRSDVKPEGRQALDQFSRELAGASYEVITVEGHTDRLGSSAYNEKLSARRADSVKSYLVSAGGIDPNTISAQGKGESQPVTTPEACRGDRPTPSLIACLQPDRRVEVEVTGTR